MLDLDDTQSGSDLDINDLYNESDSDISDIDDDSIVMAPNDTAYKRWSCHIGLKLLCKLCGTSRPNNGGPIYCFFGHAGHADPLDGWRCCSQKWVILRPIQVRQL